MNKLLQNVNRLQDCANRILSIAKIDKIEKDFETNISQNPKNWKKSDFIEWTESLKMKEFDLIANCVDKNIPQNMFKITDLNILVIVGFGIKIDVAEKFVTKINTLLE